MPWPRQLLWKEACNWGWLTVQRYSPLLSWRETWWHAGRHDAREGAESSTWSTCSQQKVTAALGLAWTLKTSKPSPLVNFFFNKVIFTPITPHLLIVPLPIGQAFSHMSLEGHFYSNHHTGSLSKTQSLLIWLVLLVVLVPGIYICLQRLEFRQAITPTQDLHGFWGS
jgi:hypothetical protein